MTLNSHQVTRIYSFEYLKNNMLISNIKLLQLRLIDEIFFISTETLS